MQSFGCMTDRVEHEVFVRAPIERVWSLMTQAEGLAGWYAFDGAEVDLRPDGRLVFRWKEHGAFFGRIVQVTPPTYLSFRFVGHVPDVEPRAGNSTLVEFHLARHAEGTRVQVVEHGFSTLTEPDEGGVAKAQLSLSGWRSGFERLKAHVET